MICRSPEELEKKSEHQEYANTISNSIQRRKNNMGIFHTKKVIAPRNKIFQFSRRGENMPNLGINSNNEVEIEEKDFKGDIDNFFRPYFDKAYNRTWLMEPKIEENAKQESQ